MTTSSTPSGETPADPRAGRALRSAADATTSGPPVIVALLDPSAPCHEDCQHPDLDHRTLGEPCRTRGGRTLRDPAIISREAFADLYDTEDGGGALSAAWALVERANAFDPAFGDRSVETLDAFDAITKRGGAIPLPDGREILLTVSSYIAIVQMIEDARQRPKSPEYRSVAERKRAILRVFNAAERGESLLCQACRHTDRSACWCVRDADSSPAAVIPLADVGGLRRAAGPTRRVVGVVIAEDPHADRDVLAEILAVDGKRRWWRQDALRGGDDAERAGTLVGGLVLVRDADAPAWARAFFSGKEGA